MQLSSSLIFDNSAFIQHSAYIPSNHFKNGQI